MSGSTSGMSLLNAWGWPFIWILLIPIVTGPWTSELLPTNRETCTLLEHHVSSFDPDIWLCPREDVLPALLPGLLNLVAFGWVLSGRWKVRWAALLAGTLGAVRLAAPLLIVGVSGADVRITDTASWQLAQGPESAVAVSGGLWYLSGASALAFLVGANMVEWRKRRRAAAANQARAQDERIRLLDRLRDEGLITDEEYESKRADLPSGP